MFSQSSRDGIGGMVLSEEEVAEEAELSPAPVTSGAGATGLLSPAGTFPAGGITAQIAADASNRKIAGKPRNLNGFSIAKPQWDNIYP